MATESESRTWAMVLHLSLLAGSTIIPFAGWIAPILIWQLKKAEMPELDAHGRNVVNWIISSVIYGAICAVLSMFVIGIPLGIALYIATIVFPIIGGIKANSGVVWKYPLTISFI